MGRGKRHQGRAGTGTPPAGIPAGSASADRAQVVEQLDNPPASGAKRDPSLIVLVGVSGAGKDTLIKGAGSRLKLRKPISVTSRAPREGEVDGVDYHFLSREQFEQRVAQGDVFEWAEFNGNYYGTLNSEFEGDDLKVAIRENQGAKEIKERLGAVVVGVFPPSLDAVRERMIARGDEAADVDARLALDRERADEIRGFADYIVVNDDVEQATDGFVSLLDSLARQSHASHASGTGSPAVSTSYGMDTEEGETALETLMERIDLSLEPDVDLDDLERELQDGLDLIAGQHPEVKSETVQANVRARLDKWLAEMGLGPAPEPFEPR